MARSTAELQSTLEAYQSARDDILANRLAEFDIDGHHFTLHNLTTLEKQIDHYARLVGQATRLAAGRGGFSVARFGGPA